MLRLPSRKMHSLALLCLIYAVVWQVNPASCSSSSTTASGTLNESVGSAAANSNDNRLPEKVNSLYTFWKLVQDSSRGQGLTAAATTLGGLFKKFVQVELGSDTIRDYYGSLQFDENRTKSLEDQVASLSDLIVAQFKDYESALENLAQAVQVNAVQEHGTVPKINSCCDIEPENLIYDKYFKTQVFKYEACKTVSGKRKPSLFIPNYSFNKALIENAKRLPHLKWQHFVSPEGVHVEYPGNSHSCKVSGNSVQPLLNTKGPSGKKLWLIQKTKDDTRNHRIVFLIQLGKDTTLPMIKSIRNIVLLLLRFLDEVDEVGIVNSDADLLWSDFLCDQMVPVTSWTKYQIMSYLSYIESKHTRTQQTVDAEESEGRDSEVTASGIQKAINMVCANFSVGSLLLPPSAATIIHLRSGVNLEGFSLQPFKVNCPVFLDTFFLKSLSTADEEAYKKSVQLASSKNIYRIQVLSTAQIEPDSFAVKVALKLNSKKEWWSLSDILSQFFPKPNDMYTKNTDFSFPHWSPISKEIVIIAKKYVFHTGRPLGLVAIEIPLTYFTQHITFYVNENVCDGRNYAFMINKNGRVLAHPALGRPDISPEILSPVQIDQIEVHGEFTSIKRQILTQEKGCQSVVLRGKKSLVTYTWSVVGEFDYIVVLVLHDYEGGCASYRQDPILKKAYLNPSTDIQHHLLLKDPQFCYKQMISLNKASLYLAPNAFSRPADVISLPLSNKSASKQPLALMAYIGDTSGFLENQNRGLKQIVKYHIAALSISVRTWKRQHYKSEWSKYILRRFGTSGGGTFLLTFPGSVITNGYVPLASKWFRAATSGSGKISFTPPMLDFNSGIPFSTISQVVEVGPSSTSKGKVVPMAVVGVDVNLGFFQKILEDALPECRNVTSGNSSYSFTNGTRTSTGVIRCFLLDEAGYLIYHPQLAKSLKTTTNVHVTQLEPLFVIDMLQFSQYNQGTPMQKKMCHKLSEASATQGSLQRVYVLNMSKNGFEKSKPGEHCSKYMIVPIPGTNIFAVVIHDSCASAAFCPCSTVDKLCLNCLRMEPSDCECPCECPREPSFCSLDSFSGLTDDIEPCEFPSESLPMIQEEDWNYCNISGTSDNLNCSSECVLRQQPCNSFTSKENCIGSWDCTWCVEDTLAGELSPPSCKSYRECYGFPVAKEIVAKDGSQEDAAGFPGDTIADIVGGNDDEDDNVSAVLPAIGVLLVFIVFLALVVYCYRHRALTSSNSQPDLHLLPLQESPRCSIVPQAGSSRSDSDGEPYQVPIHQPIEAGRRRQNRFFAPPRSPLGSIIATDSDHGYSTMTPHEDSECGAALPFVMVDPPPVLPLLGTREPRSSADATKEHPLRDDPAITSLTEVNRVTVPVSVHRELST